MAEIVRLEGLKELLETMQRLAPEIVSRRGGPVRVALRKAAVVVQKEYRANVDRIAAEGETNESTGTLRKAIIVSRKKPGKTPPPPRSLGPTPALSPEFPAPCPIRQHADNQKSTFFCRFLTLQPVPLFFCDAAEQDEQGD